MNNKVNKQLVHSYLNGDKQAFDMLVALNNSFLRCAIVRFTKISDFDLDDICQEVWIKVMNRVHTWKQDAQFTTWLYRIAINEVIMARRKERTRTKRLVYLDDTIHTKENTQFTLGEVIASNQDIENEVVVKSTLNSLLDKLPNSYKQTLLLKAKGFDNKEVAAMIGRSHGTVKSGSFRAKTWLRKHGHVEVKNEERI